MIGERRLSGREPRLEKMAVDTPEARETRLRWQKRIAGEVRSRVAWARGRRDACNGARERREESGGSSRRVAAARDAGGRQGQW